MQFDASINLNYYITKRFSIYAIARADYFLPKSGTIVDYTKTIGLGGGLGYVLLPAEDSDWGVFQARAFVTSSVDNSNLKNTAYNVGIYYYGNSQCHKLVPVVGVGYACKDYHTKGVPTYNGAYLSIGLRF